MEKRYNRLRYACYTINISMSAVTVLSSILFLTLRELYGIPYSLLGLLVVINFVTQLGVDLFLSFFSHRINIPCAIKLMPWLTVAGLLIYALAPVLFPGAVYAGLVVGTVIFAAAAGLNEVLTSPVIASIPAKDPDREMSKLHSTYAWGVVGVIIFSTLFLFALGRDQWQWLVLILSLIPVVSAVLFTGVEIPQQSTPERAAGVIPMLKNPTLWVSVLAIFLGGASEAVMTHWSSAYLESALGIPKVLGDVFGVALFAAMLGLGRTLYAQRGKHVERILVLGVIGAAVCYLVAAISSIPVVGLLACALTGLCVSMLWPGNLVVVAKRFPTGGVFLYAMMASGGDLGSAIAPELVGIVTDAAILNPTLREFAATLSLTPDQLGMKIGMLVAMVFPILALPIYIRFWRKR